MRASLAMALFGSTTKFSAYVAQTPSSEHWPWLEKLGSLALLAGFIWLFFSYLRDQNANSAKAAEAQAQTAAQSAITNSRLDAHGEILRQVLAGQREIEHRLEIIKAALP